MCELFALAHADAQQTSPTTGNPAFGKLTHEQWIQLNLRRAELHPGFQVPPDGS
jgi:hypothetical protein